MSDMDRVGDMFYAQVGEMELREKIEEQRSSATSPAFGAVERAGFNMESPGEPVDVVAVTINHFARQHVDEFHAANAENPVKASGVLLSVIM